MFMTGFMALHLGVMVELMPAYKDDPRVFTQNGLQLSKPRVTRFFAHAINLANDPGDGELSPTPWTDDDTALTSITQACTAGEACSAKQQIRIQNAFALTYIGDVEIPITCTAVEGKVEFSNFVDPVAKARDALDWTSADAGSGEDGVTRLGLNEITTGNNSFTVTFKPGASAPHIVEYSISPVDAESTTEVKVSCKIPTADDKAFKDAYCFDEPEDDIFELGVDGIVEVDYTATFEYK
jgi:hypothetical protein